ncbi:TRAP transporter substrate-binding protein [Vibrio breoganii]|uniref:TRAP transporter substrate-binding protein n=1 Tax=Vibrio breoganii TaxID=553239 RepID=UPI000CC79693|nr:TRAP transporter substrate-binding protein [Vibrio breoganii]PMI18561.1 C4-dicarboxylate ABC transporter substrate-binding protein [Vibrio breoganii]PMK30821.1 C4-dicarboxylate ABC transporter substrate-binding protein [Vibrio breoganii]PMK40143.1 C4-dicarboxylate ABC transporter substrate-binding protein [Vibrio breoganii]
MKKSILAISVALLSTTVAFSASARNMKLSHAMPLDHPVHQSLTWFADEVTDRTKLRVRVYPNATLGSEEASLQMLQNGTLAFTKVGGGLVSSFSEQYNVLSLPFLYKDEDDSKRVLRGPVGQGILESSEKDGFIGLAYLASGSRGFYSNTKIQTPDDMKGLKIRVQNSPIDIDTMISLGASPVPISSTEVYSALQQGVVDGAENNIPTYFANRHYEVAKYYSEDHHSMIPDILAVSTEVWSRISEEDKQTIKQISVEVLDVQDKYWDEYVAQSRADIVSAGGEIVEADVQAFQDRVKPVYDKFVQNNPQLSELLTKLQNY